MNQKNLNRLSKLFCCELVKFILSFDLSFRNVYRKN